MEQIVKVEQVDVPEAYKNAATYEALSGNFYRDNEREILNRQLKSLDLFNYKKPEDFIKLTNFMFSSE